MTDNDDVVVRFGFEPETIGLRHRGWQVIASTDKEEREAGVQVGDLYVEARDGASNPIDTAAIRQPNFRATLCCDDDTYRIYYFKPLVSL